MSRPARGHSIAVMAEAPVEHRRWTRAEYDRLVEIEFLGPDDKIELLGGYMIVREPKAPPLLLKYCWYPAPGVVGQSVPPLVVQSLSPGTG